VTETFPHFVCGDLLLVVDVQKDFCPGGALPIENGDEIVPVINHWINAVREAGRPIYLSRDWHPQHHLSFVESGGKWPPHCIQDTPGAGFHPRLKVPHDAVIVTKGTRFDQDQNSVFDQTGLADWLHRLGINRIFVAGLALDVCVLASVLDGQEAGFEMHIIEEATRPVNAEDGRTAITKMRRAGAIIMTS
jgi:nicotinamidase/pyrazinamidase